MAYKQKRFISQYSGDCKDQGTGRFSVWGGPTSWLDDWLFSMCPQVVEKARKFSVVSFIRMLIHSWGLHPHDLITCWRLYLQIPLHWDIIGGLGFNIWIWSEVKLLSHVRLFATPWTVAYQDPLSMGFFQTRILEWVAISFSRRSSRPRDWTQVSDIVGRRFTIWAIKEAQTFGLRWWISDNESACQCRRRGFSPWMGKVPWKRN